MYLWLSEAIARLKFLFGHWKSNLLLEQNLSRPMDLVPWHDGACANFCVSDSEAADYL